MLGGLETGDRAPSLAMLIKLAEALAIGVGDLVEVQRRRPAAIDAPEGSESQRLFTGLAPSVGELALRLARELAEATLAER